MRIPIGILAAVGLLTSISAAHAMTITIWTGSGLPLDAQAAAPPATELGVYAYNGPIDFVNNNPQGGSNTFGDFFGPTYSHDLSWISGASISSLLATTMSVDGNGTTTYLQITGNYSTGTAFSGTITHDDGAGLYLNGSSSSILDNPAGQPGCDQQQSTETCSFTIQPGSGTFELAYTEDNGAPAVLQATIPTPEPASLAIFASGLLGLTLLQRRRQRG